MNLTCSREAIIKDQNITSNTLLSIYNYWTSGFFLPEGTQYGSLRNMDQKNQHFFFGRPRWGLIGLPWALPFLAIWTPSWLMTRHRGCSPISSKMEPTPLDARVDSVAELLGWWVLWWYQRLLNLANERGFGRHRRHQLRLGVLAIFGRKSKNKKI